MTEQELMNSFKDQAVIRAAKSKSPMPVEAYGEGLGKWEAALKFWIAVNILRLVEKLQGLPDVTKVKKCEKGEATIRFDVFSKRGDRQYTLFVHQIVHKYFRLRIIEFNNGQTVLEDFSSSVGDKENDDIASFSPVPEHRKKLLRQVSSLDANQEY